MTYWDMTNAELDILYWNYRCATDDYVENKTAENEKKMKQAADAYFNYINELNDEA